MPRLRVCAMPANMASVCAAWDDGLPGVFVLLSLKANKPLGVPNSSTTTCFLPEYADTMPSSFTTPCVSSEGGMSLKETFCQLYRCGDMRSTSGVSRLPFSSDGPQP